MPIGLTPEILLQAYAAGIFPMAESAEDPELFWVDPTRRGILPLDAFHVPRRLRRVVRRDSFVVRADTAFAAVMRGCAEASETRPSTWINDEIVELYTALAERGAAHSVECWQGEELAGGLYGSARRFLARACSAASPTPARSRSSISSRASGSAATASSTPSL